ncbi:MAG: hypothetical protein B6244_10790, partial [Candidatus Cloacimonetes bacterium 4572_55]
MVGANSPLSRPALLSGRRAFCGVWKVFWSLEVCCFLIAVGLSRWLCVGDKGKIYMPVKKMKLESTQAFLFEIPMMGEK